MRAVIQRVSEAFVTVDGRETGRIQRGLCALIGVEAGDGPQDAKYLAGKIVKLRIFEDENEKMNLNVSQVNGNVLVVSQFTLAANTASGNRPSFDPAMPPAEAKELYDKFMKYAEEKFPTVQHGEFAADMKVALENDGPVTFILKL